MFFLLIPGALFVFFAGYFIGGQLAREHRPAVVPFDEIAAAEALEGDARAWAERARCQAKQGYISDYKDCTAKVRECITAAQEIRTRADRALMEPVA